MRDKIVIIESLIFVLPFLILLYIIYQGNYHFDLSQVIMFMGIAIFILAGMIILRQILGKFSIIAMSLKKAESDNAVPIDIQKDVVELHEISVSLNNLLQKLEQVTGESAQKSFELSTIKDMTEIIKGNLSIDDQMNLLLEKSMAVTGAQIGSVFMVEPESRQKYMAMLKSAPISLSAIYRFRVIAVKGHNEELKKDSLINIDSSVVKAVLLERGPLLITDIEKDPRSLKTNDPKYGPPSFLSMPIFIGDDVSAILNLAYKGKGQLFDSNDEKVLSIMFRDISFALEIVMLQSRIMGQLARIKGHNLELEKEIEGRKRTERALIESEKKFRLLVENSNDIIYTINLTGHFVYVNPVAEHIIGSPASDLIGRQYLSLVRPDYHEEIDAFYKKQFNENIPSTYFEFPVIVKDGSTKWIGQNAQLLSKDDKNIGFQAMARDITERKRAEEVLRESEEKYLLAFESTSDGIFTIDRNFNISSITPSVERQLGYKVEEVINRPIQDLNILTLESLTRAVSDVIQVLSGVEVKGAVYEFIAKDGTRKIGEVTGTPIIREGKILGVTAVVRDITERKRIEETLAESEKKYRELVDFLPISLFETDIQGNVTSANPAIFETFGYTQPDFEKSLNGFQMIIPDDQEKLAGNIQRLLNGEWKGPSEYTGLRKDGSTFPFLIFPSVVIREGKPVGLRGAIIDLTDRKRIEESLKKSNLSLAEAQRIAHIGNWEWNIESDDMYCSDEISRIVGAATPQMFDGTYEAFSELVFPEDREMVKKAVEKAMHEGATSEIEHRIVRRDGSVREVLQLLEPIIDDSGKIIKVVGTIQDVTERNQVERDLQNARDQLLQSEKLASMGRLSAGVAHEILNPVNIISMELQLLQAMESLPPEVLEELKICMAQISRIVIIAENLKQFSRIPEKQTVMADINDTIAHVLSLYATQLKIEGIETEVQYQSDLPVIAMDKEKIEQVILNLISNATSSMEGKKKKTLRIKTEKETEFGDHDQLKITIADTGTGIKNEHMLKIFDPFFTTKKQGKGTGLGLSISYGIVHDHGGMIWAENNKWGGASFCVRLPVKTDIENKPLLK